MVTEVEPNKLLYPSKGNKKTLSIEHLTGAGFRNIDMICSSHINIKRIKHNRLRNYHIDIQRIIPE